MKLSSRWRSVGVALILSLPAVACKSHDTAENEFFTSGSHEADQRAEQRMAKEEQLAGDSMNGSEKSKREKTLFERLGGEAGLSAIVSDFVDRALADPRTNWERKGVSAGGVLGIGSHSSEWSATPEKVAALKEHIAQFLQIASAGPARYEGREMRDVHAKMKITNDEFNASVGDLKASLDKLQVAPGDQKELLAIVESTRPQIVEKR